MINKEEYKLLQRDKELVKQYFSDEPNVVGIGIGFGETSGCIVVHLEYADPGGIESTDGIQGPDGFIPIRFVVTGKIRAFNG